jgi:hypothetical protein
MLARFAEADAGVQQKALPSIGASRGPCPHPANIRGLDNVVELNTPGI